MELLHLEGVGIHKVNSWSAHKTNNPQGTDFREVTINGKISKLQFTVKPNSDFWRAGFKLFDPNGDVFPLRNDDSLLFHLGSTPSNTEYGLTAYLDGEWVKELNKTRKYPESKLLSIKLKIDHNNFLKVFVNGSLEFKPAWHLENPNIREKVVLIAWGDEHNYEVDFKNIAAGNWKDVETKRQMQRKGEKQPVLQVSGENVFLNSRVEGSTLVGGKKNIFSKTKNGNKNSSSSKLIAISTIIAALITAPWWTQVFQKFTTKNPSYTRDKTESTPSIFSNPSTLPTLIQTPIKSGTKVEVFINEGKSYTDETSGITVGVNYVLSRSHADLTITFPGKPSEKYDDTKSGKRLNFRGRNGSNYILTIVEIMSDSVGARVDPD